MPNKQDGDGYTLIMGHPDGASVFGAWVACVQIASRCDPRGTLLRDGKKPHDSSSLSRMSRIPTDTIDKMLEITSNPDVNWLEVTDLRNTEEIVALRCEIPALECLEGKGREGIERNEGKELEIVSPLKVSISEMYHRKPDDLWSYGEQCLLMEVSRRRNAVSECVEIADFKSASPKFFPQSIERLLSGWSATLDRARSHSDAKSEDKPSSILERELKAIERL